MNRRLARLEALDLCQGLSIGVLASSHAPDFALVPAGAGCAVAPRATQAAAAGGALRAQRR
jgi:hypothetical protein